MAAPDPLASATTVLIHWHFAKILETDQVFTTPLHSWDDGLQGAAHLRRGPAQWDDGMGPLPARSLVSPLPYDSLAVHRSRSAFRLRPLCGTLVEAPCAVDDLAVGFPEFCLGFRARLPSALPLPHLLPRLWEYSVRDEFLASPEPGRLLRIFACFVAEIGPHKFDRPRRFQLHLRLLSSPRRLRSL